MKLSSKSNSQEYVMKNRNISGAALCTVLDSCPVLYTKNLAYPQRLQKSDNLQYNMLGCWVDGTNDSLTNRPCSKHYFFFIISYRLRALKTLYKKIKRVN